MVPFKARSKKQGEKSKISKNQMSTEEILMENDLFQELGFEEEEESYESQLLNQEIFLKKSTFNQNEETSSFNHNHSLKKFSLDNSKR